MGNHRNIPIFVPHLGCPNMCVFCNQRSITAKESFSFEDVRKTLENTFDGEKTSDKDTEIAFFSGSFTGIDRALMVSLLELAESYISKGKASGIRLSTRPDYINKEILDILGLYSVKAIELGIQSMSEKVLIASKRGHTTTDSINAAYLIKERGYELVGQMMTGLPQSERADEILTANAICDMGCDGTRIYPTVVLNDTELCEMSKRGEYTPRGVKAAVKDAVEAYKIFLSRGVKILRVGLCANDGLSAGEIYGGGYHEAIGEMVQAEIYYEKAYELLNNKREEVKGKDIVLYAPCGEVSKLIGHHSENKKRLMDEFSIRTIKFYIDENLGLFNVKDE